MTTQIEIIDYLARVLRVTEDSLEMSVRDLLHTLTWLHWHDQCRRCRQVIVNFSGENGCTSAPWSHSGGSRSCKSAIFDADTDDRDPDKLRAWAEADPRLMAIPVREQDYVSWPVTDLLDDNGLHGKCHVCQVKAELLKGRSGHGWDWTAAKI